MPKYVYQETNSPSLDTGKPRPAFTAVAQSGAVLLIQLLEELERRHDERAVKDRSTPGPVVEVRWGRGGRQ